MADIRQAAIMLAGLIDETGRFELTNVSEGGHGQEELISVSPGGPEVEYWPAGCPDVDGEKAPMDMARITVRVPGSDDLMDIIIQAG